MHLTSDYFHPCKDAGGNPARFNLSRGIGPPDERWRSVLSAAQLERFERIAGALNRQLGYE